MSLNLPYYVASFGIRTTNPKDYYIKQKQAEINNKWDMSTQVSEVVLMQQGIGSTEYKQMPISIDMAIDMGTGLKKSDDFKVFSHKDISIEHPIGLMYQYANNYWLTINSSNLASVVASVEVRRCNNTLKWIDKTNGFVNEVPCVIDYELSSPSPQRDKDVIVANGHCVVMCQDNDLTKKIEKNQRFIFNGQPFKLSAINNLHYDDIETTLTPLLMLDLYLDVVNPDDDLINNIANKSDYIYTISVNNAISSQVSNFNGQLLANVYCNNQIVNREIIWESNQYGIIDNQGNYTLSGDIGDIAIFSASIAGNPNVKEIIQIEIVEQQNDLYSIEVIPNFTEIRQKETISFNAWLYKNGVKQDNVVNAMVTNGNKYVSLMNDSVDNGYSLTCVGLSNKDVEITFTSDNIEITKHISLKPYF